MPSTDTLPRPAAILWDMDGTLIDQTAGIIRCYCEVIEAMGYPRPEAEKIRRSLGGPMASTMALFVKNDQMEAACTAFRQRFPHIMFEGLILLSGGSEMIARAQEAQIPQAIFTNKHGDTARQVSEYAGFAKQLPLCIGSGDTEWSKPDKRLTKYVLEKLQVPAEGAIIIGDSPTDIAVAVNAGLICYAVATGAHSIEELKEAGARAAYANLSELSESIDWKASASHL